MRTIIDVHAIQSVPPSNLNRDDTGSPKTAEYGGVRRARVSSQAWKRASRTAFTDTLEAADLGVRTKRVVELLGAEIAARGIEAHQAKQLAVEAFQAAKIKLSAPKRAKDDGDDPESTYLLFLSRQQLANLAELAATTGLGTAQARQAVKAEFRKSNSVDLALFGRMVADDKDLNVDAACQVAHAISVHRVTQEFDYFTAVDDVKQASEAEDAGAGMIGNVEFNSATLYRYATVDVDRLHDNLGDAEATRRAVVAFIRAFATSMPSGKQNTFANRTLPHLIYVTVRSDQPVNLVGAYESAIPARAEGYLHESVSRLASHEDRIRRSFGLEPDQAWHVLVDGAASGLGEQVTMPELLDAIGQAVAARIPGS